MSTEWRTSVVLKASLVYFGLVFGAGFVLGVVRTLLVVPRVGVRPAELMEAPLMLIVAFLAAKRVVRTFRVPATIAVRFLVGAIALIILVSIEFTMVLSLRGLTLADYFRERDPVSGTVYFTLLAIFAVMPLVVSRERRGE